MAFFDDISKKMKDLSDTSKINSMITATAKELDGLYLELGRRIYAQYGSAPDAPFPELIQAICAKQRTLDQYKEHVNSIKGITNCPNCGAAVANGTAFCPTCGTQQPKPPAPPSGTVFCSSCGAPMSAGARFCARCGSKML